jgi:bacillithiol system protein YtxJ
MIKPCENEEAFHQIIRESGTHPIVLFKHSTRCPVSAGARKELVAFSEHMPEVECREVLVIEQRPLSQQIAQETGVAHQSPQALLFKGGTVVWNASHFGITEKALKEAYEKVV